MGKGIILPLPKKGDHSFCNNNRGITLLDLSEKAFFTILLLRVKDAVDLKMRENQASFRKGRSCQDQIFSLNQLIEKCLDQQLPCLINFIDFKPALIDSVHRPLWQILRIYGIPSNIVNIIQNSYRDTTCAQMMQAKLSESPRCNDMVADSHFPRFFRTAVQCEIARRFPRSVVKVGLQFNPKTSVFWVGFNREPRWI